MSAIKSFQRTDTRKTSTPALRAAPEVDAVKLRELTETIAYELYEKEGRVDGRALDHWIAAEKSARARLASST